MLHPVHLLWFSLPLLMGLKSLIIEWIQTGYCKIFILPANHVKLNVCHSFNQRWLSGCKKAFSEKKKKKESLSLYWPMPLCSSWWRQFWLLGKHASSFSAQHVIISNYPSEIFCFIFKKKKSIATLFCFGCFYGGTLT